MNTVYFRRALNGIMCMQFTGKNNICITKILNLKGSRDLPSQQK